MTRDPKGEATVMVVDGENKVEPRTVKAAQSLGDEWLVTAGLAAGDRVIVEGLQKVKPRQRRCRRRLPAHAACTRRPHRRSGEVR